MVNKHMMLELEVFSIADLELLPHDLLVPGLYISITMLIS